jgi:crotonobetainyl-CoA:carnitine CoA-transferase CaiB-like acyl-CoA transferase
MVVELTHPEGGSTRGPGNPIKLSRTDEESFSPAPLLGQHTETVLKDLLGYSENKLSGLRDAGAVL